MKITKMTLDPEKKLITNMIVSKEFISAIIPIFKSYYLKSPMSRIVGEWLIEFYELFKTNPGKSIQDIYNDKKKSIRTDEESELVASFLTKLSTEYENLIPYNVEYSINQAVHYLKTRNLELLKEDVNDALQKNDPVTADERVRDFMPLFLSASKGSLYSKIGELEITPPNWLIDGLFEKDSTTVLFGDPGVGKSFIALDMGSSIASNIDFHSHGTKVQGPVIYIAGEGKSSISRRCRAWEQANEIQLSTIPFYILNVPIILLEGKTILSLEQSLKSISQDDGIPALIIIDTWNRLEGGDENSNSDAAKAIAVLDRLRAPYHCSVLIVHHSGHGDKQRARGASALRAAADNEILVEQNTAGTITLTSTKCKDGKAFEPMAFNLVDVDLGIKDENGQPVTSAVLEQIGFVKESIQKTMRGNNNKTLKILENLLNENEAVTTGMWQKACLADGNTESTFFRNRKKLMDDLIVLYENNIYKINHSTSTLTSYPFRGVRESKSKEEAENGNSYFPNKEQSNSKSSKVRVNNEPYDENYAVDTFRLKLLKQRKATHKVEATA